MAGSEHGDRAGAYAQPEGGDDDGRRRADAFGTGLVLAQRRNEARPAAADPRSAIGTPRRAERARAGSRSSGDDSGAAAPAHGRAAPAGRHLATSPSAADGFLCHLPRSEEHTSEL